MIFLLVSLLLMTRLGLDASQLKTRNIFTGFKSFIEAMTDRNGIDFNNYGNYCGFGGSGTPVDELDRCCKVHDDCYGTAQKQACKDDDVYFIDYGYKAEKGSIECTADTEGEFKKLKLKQPRKYECGLTICKCDNAAARCFAKAPYDDDSSHISSKIFSRFHKFILDN